MKYANLDTKTNQPTAFYDEATHGAKQIADLSFDVMSGKNPTMIANPDCKIPASAIVIPDAVWQTHIDGVPQVYDATKKTWSAYVPTPTEVLATEKNAALAKVADTYCTSLDAGVTYNGATFQSDAKSIATLSETLTAINNGWTLPTGFAWIDATNVPHAADIPFLKGLSTAYANHKSALFARYQVAKSKIATATTIATVVKITL